ncbi:hypothetical protein E1A91_A08G074800v1 [Gossypium mustelinum]|uniref:Uncharacterized protein n=1 Tax=Gossypium mustelinum TaxID=34275 RepID=A0A5D2Y5E4_GOSMU|nr:hypothetical protein E1A91_A08G074800v1 [Gossypium mustelinum]
MECMAEKKKRKKRGRGGIFGHRAGHRPVAGPYGGRERCNLLVEVTLGGDRCNSGGVVEWCQKGGNWLKT